MATTTHIALLRGINVGGKNKLPMKDLVRLFQDAGCSNVRTHIQSGNVLFEAGAAELTVLSQSVSMAIRKDFVYDVPILIRSAKQLADILRKNPYVARGEDESLLHVMFLADTPKPGAVKHLDPRRSDPDEFVVRGREVYLYLPNGVARTKLTNAYFDAKLKTVSTGRNWRTVKKLAELATA